MNSKRQVFAAARIATLVGMIWPGIATETQESDDSKTSKAETVHTYGWYLKK
jgi:hypothetical protein